MRTEDIKRLKSRYSTVLAGGPDVRLAEFTDLPMSNIIELGDQILNDLSPETLGIGWWQDQLDEASRIAVSDHLLACVRAIGSNLLEAYASLLEYRHVIEEFDAFLQRGVRGLRSYQMPSPRGPYDDLVAVREEAHVAGVVRALGSALDCLGGAIVGVAWLPVNIVRADYGRAQSALVATRRTNPHDHRVALADSLERIFDGAGPAGWLIWLTGLRNTIVHRGRRVTTISSSIEPVAHGRPRLVNTRLLPASPGLTEVEAWTAEGGFVGSVLAEPAEVTLEQSIRSTAQAVNSGCGALLQLWQERRTNPALGPQPASQYSLPAEGALARFAGFAPTRDLTSNPRGFGAADESLRRLRAAGLA